MSRPDEATTSFASCCGEPDALAVVSDDKDKISTPLHLAASSLITSELSSDMSSVTYHPNPLIVSLCSAFSPMHLLELELYCISPVLSCGHNKDN